jgi:hypothetical protein
LGMGEKEASSVRRLSLAPRPPIRKNKYFNKDLDRFEDSPSASL